MTNRRGQEQAPKVERPERPLTAPETPPPSGGAAPLSDHATAGLLRMDNRKQRELALALEQRDAARAAVMDLNRTLTLTFKQLSVALDTLAEVTAERDQLRADSPVPPDVVRALVAAGHPITVFGVPYVRVPEPGSPICTVPGCPDPAAGHVLDDGPTE